jgi:hypothetical protein
MTFDRVLVLINQCTIPSLAWHCQSMKQLPATCVANNGASQKPLSLNRVVSIFGYFFCKK